MAPVLQHSLAVTRFCAPAHLLSQLLLVCVDPSAVSPVSQLLESVPASVQQEAVRGQALVLKQQGNAAAAKQLLADLVQSEGLEGACQHLAQADYGILLLEQADLQVILHAGLHVLMVGTVIVICRAPCAPNLCWQTYVVQHHVFMQACQPAKPCQQH